MCLDWSTAGPRLAESFSKGGVEAARAFNATTYNCTEDTNLLTLVSTAQQHRL